MLRNTQEGRRLVSWGNLVQTFSWCLVRHHDLNILSMIFLSLVFWLAPNCSTSLLSADKDLNVSYCFFIVIKKVIETCINISNLAKLRLIIFFIVPGIISSPTKGSLSFFREPRIVFQLVYSTQSTCISTQKLIASSRDKFLFTREHFFNKDGASWQAL